MAELMSRLFAVLGLLLALCGAGVRPAEAYPAQRAAALSGSPCTGKTVSLDLAANSGVGVYCLNGTRYSSPTFIPGWSFTRASTGYALNSAGTLVSFGSGVPRITDLGLLIEQSATNLALQSQSFGAAPWALTGATVSADATAAPDLTFTADKLVESSGGTFHFDQQDNTVTANTAYSIGLFVKPAGRNFLKIQASNTAANSGVAVEINLTTGALSNSTFGTGTIASSKAVAVANGFWWLQLNGVVIDATSTTLRQQLLMGSASGTYSYSGDGASGVYLWQDDVQAGAFLTSPIPTTSASATRAADSASIANAAIPGQNVTFWGKVYRPVATAAFSQIVQQGPGDPALYIASNNNLTGTIPGVADLFTAGALGVGSTKFAGAFSNGRSIGAVAGVLGTANTTTWTQGSGTTLYLGQSSTNGNPLNGYLSALAVAASTYSDAQLQALSQ